MSEKKIIIKAENITVRYGQLIVLKDVSFEVKEGEIFVIVGGSGCGKSTLLRQIIGLEKPTSGRILIDGEDFTNSAGKKYLEIQKKFGVLFQTSGLFASMTLAENIALPLEKINLPMDFLEKIIAMKLRLVGLDGFQAYLPAEISGGMRKRAGLARAMALDPKILCFDEPSSGLDPVTSAELDNLIKQINATLGTTMVVVTHDLSSIMSISHRVIMLDKEAKGIIAQGTPSELKNSPNEVVYKFFNRVA